MANAYSTATAYNDYVSPINLDLYKTVLDSKDRAYNANEAKLDAMISSYSNIKLRRSEDKQKLTDNINAMTTAVNAQSKLDLSNSNVMKQISQSISAAVTPEIMEQVRISSRLDKFDAEVDSKRKSKPELYSDENYTDALEQAGYADYMRGYDDLGNKVDSLKAPLQYSDYYDVNKNLTEPLEKWATSIGMQRYVDRKSGGEGSFYYENTKGERLTAGQIGKFYETRLAQDPKLKQQMEISSRQMFKGYSDEEFAKMYTDQSQGIASNYRAEAAATLEQRKNYKEDSEEYKALTNNIQFYQAREDEFNKRGENVNRGRAQMELYSGAIKKNYQDTYKVDNILEIEAPSAMDMAKFEMAQETHLQNRTKFNQDQEDRAKKDLELGLAGTPMIVPTEGAGELNDSDLFNLQSLAFGKASQNLDNYLNETDPNFRLADENGKKAIKDAALANMDKIDANRPQDTKKYALLGEFKYAAEQKQKTVNQAVELTNGFVTEIYTDMLNSKNKGNNINLNNLSVTMPYTVQAINKGLKMGDLTPASRVRINYEIANNAKENLAQDSFSKEELNMAMEEYQKVAKGLKIPALTKATTGSVLGNVWEGIKSTASETASAIAGTIATPIIAARQGQASAEKYASQNIKEQFDSSRDASRAWSQAGDAFLSLFRPDSDLSNLQSRDLEREDTENAYNVFARTFNTGREQRKQALLESAERTPVSTGVSFNPLKAADKPMIEDIDSLLRSKGIVPADKSKAIYNLRIDGSDVIIQGTGQEFTLSKTGAERSVTSPSTVRLPINQVPARLISMVDTSSKSYVYDVNNPADFNQTFKYSVPKSQAEKNSNIAKVVQSSGGLITQKLAEDMSANMGSIPSYEEYYQYVDTEDKRAKMSEVINAKYEVSVQRIQGKGFAYSMTRNGKPLAGELLKPSYTPADGLLVTNYFVDQHIKNELNKLRRK